MWVAIAQRWPNGSRTEPARSPCRWSSIGLICVAPASSARACHRVGVLDVERDERAARRVAVGRDEAVVGIASQSVTSASPIRRAAKTSMPPASSRVCTSAPNARS